MGQSTNAILYFGVELGEEVDWAPGSGDEEVAEENEWACAHEAKSLGFTLDNHCSCDYPMLFLAAVIFEAWRGSPKEIPGELPVVSLATIQKMQKFLVDWEFEPKDVSAFGWRLVSMWC